MSNKIVDLKKIINLELEKSDIYPYLPDILAILEQIEIFEKNEKNKIEINKLLGGLVRLITEDDKFYRSKIGKKLMNYNNKYKI